MHLALETLADILNIGHQHSASMRTLILSLQDCGAYARSLPVQCLNWRHLLFSYFLTTIVSELCRLLAVREKIINVMEKDYLPQ